MVVLGVALVARPGVDELVGQWRQHDLAAVTDASVSRYRNAVVAAYAVTTSDFEDALVSFEIGAVPTTADGRRLMPGAAVPTTATSGRFHGSGRTPAELTADAPLPGVYVTQRDAVRDVAAPSTGTATTGDGSTRLQGAIIRIPKIGLSQAVVDGVSRGHLKNGPGHYPGTAIPGYSGNAVISGHRTTYTKPFLDLDLLAPGDEVIVDKHEGSFRYLVERSHVAAPDDIRPLQATDRPVLTLTTCTPKGTADQRLIVVAVLDAEPLEAPGSGDQGH